MTSLSVAVIGATGYTGAELCALLARHPRARMDVLTASPGSAGASFASLHPSLEGLEGPEVAPFMSELVLARRPDCAFLATPDKVSAEMAPALLEAGITVIDLSGAFRLPSPGDYPRWYGFDHPHPGLLGRAVYGLTEWCNGELSGARLVANPGCYPTSILLALKPIAGMLDPVQPIVCDAKSGVSGAGRRGESSYSFAELSGNFRAYGVGRHRHEPEIRSRLGLDEEAPLSFVAHLLPAVRGILSTIHVGFARPVSEEDLTSAFRAAYADSPFVALRPAGRLPELREVVGTPRAALGFTLTAGGRRAVIVSVIDNLLKGAASQAVQNFNRVFGFDEREGLA